MCSGGFRLRAAWEKEEGARGVYQVVVTEIPYQVQKAKLIERIAELIEQILELVFLVRQEPDRHRPHRRQKLEESAAVGDAGAPEFPRLAGLPERGGVDVAGREGH